MLFRPREASQIRNPLHKSPRAPVSPPHLWTLILTLLPISKIKGQFCFATVNQVHPRVQPWNRFNPTLYKSKPTTATIPTQEKVPPRKTTTTHSQCVAPP